MQILTNLVGERVVVTGGAGFIGSHIVDRLAEGGAEISVIDNLSSGSVEHVPSIARLFEEDVSNPSTSALIEGLRPHVVIHAAAQVSVPVSTQDPELDRRVNLRGTENVIMGALRASAKRFVFVSSGGAVYGATKMATEDDVPAPENPYGIHKLAAEGYTRTSGLSFGIARPSNVYGPRQRAGLEGGVAAIFAERLANGQPITIYGSGRQTRDFVHVSDVVDAVLAIAVADASGTWNVSTGVSTSVIELLRELEAVMGRDAEVSFAPSRPGDVETSTLSPDRIEEDLGWSARVELAIGLARLAESQSH